MKRLLMSLIVLLVVVAGIIASLPLFVSSATVRSYILDHLRGLTGREISFRGDPSVSFQPFLGIEINNLTISDPYATTTNSPLLSVERVKAQLDILPALFGNIKITQYRLESPRLNLKVYADGNSSWLFKDGEIEKAYKETLEALQDETIIPQSTALGTFVIIDGAVSYEDTITGHMDNITSINAIVDWPQTNAATDITTQASWHGETINANIDITEPLKLMAGGETLTKFTLNSTPATIEFDGTANMLANLFVKGALKLKTLSLKRFSEFFEIDFSGIYAPGELELSGNIEASSGSVRLVDAEVKIAGHSASGVLSMTKDELDNTSLDGTLAFETVDLSEYLGQPAVGQDETTATIKPPDVNVDLRISADTLSTGIFELEKVAAAVNVSGQNWTIDIGDSQAFGGNIVARIGQRTEDETPLVLADISAKNLDMAEFSSVFSETLIGSTGRGNLDVSLRTRDISSILNINNLSGTISANLVDGAISGIDFRSLLNSSSEDLEQNTGPGQLTEFQSSTLKMFIINGVASHSQTLHSEDQEDIGIVGRVDLRQGNLALTVEASGDSPGDIDRLFIGGTLRAPLVSNKRTSIRKNSPTEDDAKISN